MLILCPALCMTLAQADPLSPADRETLLDNLEKIQNAADTKIDERYKVAIDAYRNALTSDDAAMSLYMNCIEKVNFDDQAKKSADFREWKRKEADKLSDTGFRLALRYQLRWLVLTLQAASPNADRSRLTGQVQDTLDSIFRDISKLKNQQQLLGQSVLSSVFARAYDINHVKAEDWPTSPLDLDGVYGTLLFPPNRIPSRVPTLRALWIKRIQQETLRQEAFNGRQRDEKKATTVENMQSPEFTKFLQEGVPRMQWQMEVDLFKAGDENGAAVRMLDHLKKYVNHPSARDWGEQFKGLLKPKLPISPGDPGTASTN